MHGFASLGSGSKGNCLYLGTTQTKILIDAGLSARATKNRLAEIGVSLEEISAILISHEHSDHIAGLKTLVQKYNLPILANSQTANAIYKNQGICPQFKIFTTSERFTYKNIEVFPFSVTHDAIDPVGFTLSFDKIKLGICTDCGFATSLIKHHLKQCHYLFVEANHDPNMVHACPRPPIYKQRVLGRSGHLSNEACGQLVKEVLHDDLKEVQLGHLSKECNHPIKALEALQQVLPPHVQLQVASQDEVGKRILFSTL